MYIFILDGMTVDFVVSFNRQLLSFDKIECFFEIYNVFKINFCKKILI